MKKLLKTERFLLENAGPNYNSYRCQTHGVFQVVKGAAPQGHCVYYKQCTAPIEVIADPIAYAKAN